MSRILLASATALSLLVPCAKTHAADSVIVKFRPGASASARRKAIARAGAGTAVGAVPALKAKVLASAGSPPADVAASLDRSRAVAYAEVNVAMHATADPQPAQPADARFGDEPDLALIEAPAGWAAARLGDFPAAGGARVGIVDTGIDGGHEDLRGKVAACATASGGTVTDGACADDNDHGTHVAGTIGATANNGVGIAGVAFASPLVICKALDGDGSGTLADVANCIGWAHARGARVISMSLGGPGSVTLQKAVADAWEGGGRGGSLIVAAAGNDGNGTTEYPAGYPEVVSVSATDDAGGHAGFSNINPDVEVAAPGVDVLSTKRGGGYVRFSGTSMATPHVAGVAALALQHHRTLSAAGLRRRLDASARDLGPTGRDDTFGFGLVDAAAASR